MKIPSVNEERPHWKVGDKMGYTENDSFIIGQMVLVDIGNNNFTLDYYDDEGNFQGKQELILKKSRVKKVKRIKE